MKIRNLLLLAAALLFFQTSQAQLLGTIKDKVKQKVNNTVGNETDKQLDKADPTQQDNNSNQNNSSTQNDNSSATTSATAAAAPTLTTYQNYDFVPGDTILFADDFLNDQDGEFPAHWDLVSGQGVINKVGTDPAFFLTEGNYVRVAPLMKTKDYLTDPFTVEFDYYIKDAGQYGIICFLQHKEENSDEETSSNVTFSGSGEVSTGYFPKDFSADYPGDKANFSGKWHHGAIILKNNQMKCYLDQYRVLVVPNVGFQPTSIQFGGIGSQESPIIFRNVRVAAGGNMNLIGKKFTESKIVTHGINFDFDKATIKPESMGTLNMIANVMKSNPDVKFEIDGHTDNVGGDAYNLTLSQQRADAVKVELVTMGIDASRLSTKGYGDSKPLDSNDTDSGRANNRRVEFVKM